MNRVALLMGVLGSVMASLCGMILFAQWQLMPLDETRITLADGSTVTYPEALDTWREVPGRQLYRSLGCIYCHSQQVRPEPFGADIARGWGERRSVPRDYAGQSPPLLGTMRTGPDLANIAARQPSDAWHHVHLFDARLVSPGSVMPPLPFLYDLETHDPGSRGYKLPKAASKSPQDLWIVPQEPAQQLVAYIKTLEQKHGLQDVQ